MKTSVLILALFVARVVAQAPGDYHPRCRYKNPEAENEPFVLKDDHIFPSNWEVLVDTYDYENLYDNLFSFGNVWHPENVDGDFYGVRFYLELRSLLLFLLFWLQWEQIIGGSCKWPLYTCSADSPSRPQNNWLFSQFIDLKDANELLFNVSYRFQDCVDFSRCTDAFATIHRYDSNSVVSQTQRRDYADYVPFFGDLASSRLKQPTSTSGVVSETRSFVRDEPRHAGLYLGVHDSGTCGSINRIILYYTVCQAKQIELVKYPQVATPPRNGPDSFFHAECVPNAHNVTSLLVHAFSANSTCRDSVEGGVRCECDSGYEISSDRLSCIRKFYSAFN